MISRKEVQHIAKLARLGLTEKELKKYQKDLSSILDYVEKLKEVDVSRVEPTSHPRLIENVMREDEAKKSSPETADRLVKAVPERKGRYIRVKAVL